MYGVLAAICCEDCTGEPGRGTPAETCPDPPGSPHSATATLVISANPKAYCPVTDWTCTGFTVPCSGAHSPTTKIGAPHGTGPNPPCKVCDFEVPVPTMSGGLGTMNVWAVWPTYTSTITGGVAPATTYDTTCNACGEDSDTITTIHSDSFTLSLECSGGSSTENFGTPGVDGVSGSVAVEHCCESCDCDAEAGTPYCTQVTVVINAQWTLELTGIPFMSWNTTCDECIEYQSLEAVDYGSVALNSTFDQEFVVINSVTIVYERTVLNTQANERLAPGAYSVKSVSVSTIYGAHLTVQDTDASGPVVGDPCYWDGDCSCSDGMGTHYTETETCSDALLATHGWTVSFSVAS